MSWEFCLQDGGVSEGFTPKMAAWKFCLQDGGVSDSFTHKMAAWEICLQDGGNTRFWEFYPKDGGVRVLHTRWRRVWGFYPQNGGVEVLTTRWRRFWEFYPIDGGVGVLTTRWRQYAFLRVLVPTRWRRRRFAYKMAAMQNKRNVYKNNVEYILRLQCRIYLVNVKWPSYRSMSDVRHWTVWRSTVTRWTFDNAQRHKTAFRPISEAARSWSCDNRKWPSGSLKGTDIAAIR